MASRIRYAYLAAAGLLLIMAGAYFYESYVPTLAEPFARSPSECNGAYYMITPSYIGVKGEGRAYQHYGNGTVAEAGNLTYEVYVLNDPCKDGYVSGIVKVGSGAVPQYFNGSLSDLSSVLIVSGDFLSVYGRGAGALTGLGPAQALQVRLTPRLVQYPIGSYYYEVSSNYFEASSGILVRAEIQRSLVATMDPNAPDYTVGVVKVMDLYSAPGPGESFSSYSRASTLASLAAFLSGLYIVFGVILLVYGSSKIIL